VVEVVGLAEDWTEKAGRLVDEEIGRAEEDETGREEEGVTDLLEVAAADEGRTVDEMIADDLKEELVMAEEAGRADEVESRIEVVTTDEDVPVDDTTEDALETEAEVVTGLAPDDLSVSWELSYRRGQLTQVDLVEQPIWRDHYQHLPGEWWTAHSWNRNYQPISQLGPWMGNSWLTDQTANPSQVSLLSLTYFSSSPNLDISSFRTLHWIAYAFWHEAVLPPPVSERNAFLPVVLNRLVTAVNFAIPLYRQLVISCMGKLTDSVVHSLDCPEPSPSRYWCISKIKRELSEAVGSDTFCSSACHHEKESTRKLTRMGSFLPSV
jgi:hypothetical protein